MTRRWRAIARALLVVVGTSLVAAASLAASGWTAFGAAPSAERRLRLSQSPQWTGGRFVNAMPLRDDLMVSLRGLRTMSDSASPHHALNVTAIDPHRFDTVPASGLRVTWFGHSSALVEIDGVRVLIDPMWSERASPVRWPGPRRWYAPPIAREALPMIDVAVISHDHYDHLDHATIVALAKRGTTFVVPLGVGSHLALWGIADARIIELDWWQRTRIRNLEIVSTPARHASGRTLTDRDATLWGGYALIGAQHRVYYSGDTGMTPLFGEIGSTLGPFDITLMQVGEYGEGWPDWHLTPEDAVRAHVMVRGQVMLPVHWGLLNLAFHAWNEPIERTVAAARTAGVALTTPRPGESVVWGEPAPSSPWWTEQPIPPARSTINAARP